MNECYLIGYNSQIHKYVLMNPDWEVVGEFEFAKDLLAYCDEHGYTYTIL